MEIDNYRMIEDYQRMLEHLEYVEENLTPVDLSVTIEIEGENGEKLTFVFPDGNSAAEYVLRRLHERD